MTSELIFMPHSESRHHNLGDFKKVFFYFSAIEIAVETNKMSLYDSMFDI